MAKIVRDKMIMIGGTCIDCGHKGLVVCPGCGSLMCKSCYSHNVEEELNT